MLEKQSFEYFVFQKKEEIIFIKNVKKINNLF